MFADIMAQSPVWLPVAFAVLMGVSIAAYVILDGYDLGVGLLMGRASEAQRDTMIASIGPFWDANETWLVLGVGLLLVAFPMAHGAILTALYLPTALMLVGLILRGVAFDFRAKAQATHKIWWDRAFIFGSGLAAFTQGYMLGIYILGLELNPRSHLFGLITGFSLMAAYAFIGAGWLIMKSEGDLQRRAVRWARRTLWMAAAGMVLVSLATPWVSARIFEKWFSLPTFFLLLPIPLMAAGLFGLLWYMLRSLPRPDDRFAWVPFAGAVGIFLLGFHGLAYSFYPYVVPEKLTVWEAASAPESLMIIFVGALVVLPTIIGYTIFAYRVFWGKTQALAYY